MGIGVTAGQLRDWLYHDVTDAAEINILLSRAAAAAAGLDVAAAGNESAESDASDVISVPVVELGIQTDPDPNIPFEVTLRTDGVMLSVYDPSIGS